jgi:hypothetical protein
MRFRFKLRDLFWLMLAVALALGWWIDRSHVAEQRDMFQEALKGNLEKLMPKRPLIERPEPAASRPAA